MNKSFRPWILAESNYGYIKENQYEVAVLPLGATEPHNLHLPYGTDLFEGTMIGEHICEAAHHAGGKVVLLPTIPYGTETNMIEFPLAMNLNPSTLNYVISDLVESCVESGIKKIVLLNSHGGNDFKPTLRELANETDGHLFFATGSGVSATVTLIFSSMMKITLARWKPHLAFSIFRIWWQKTKMAHWQQIKVHGHLCDWKPSGRAGFPSPGHGTC